MSKSSPQPNVSDVEISPRFWGLILLTGVSAGITSGLLMKLLRAVEHVTYSFHFGNFLEGVEHSSAPRRLLALFVAGILAGSVLFILRRITGRGGQDLSEAVWCKAGELPPVSTLVRAVLSIVTVGMGAALGREGALKQAGTVAAGKLSDRSRLTPSQRHLLVACGAGAGMAAAYNVPFGGALFAAEVLLGTMAVPPVLTAVAASCVATAVSWLFLPDQPTYSVPHARTSVPLIFWAVLLGPIAGCLSSGYVRTIRWATSHKPEGWRLLVVPIAIFTALGAAAIAFPSFWEMARTW